MKKNTNNGTDRNLTMNPATYALRREVMQYVYEARDAFRAVNVELPRIDVRIVETTGCNLGRARCGDNIIWVSENAIKGGYDLRLVTFHEIAHTVFSAPHKATCPLMRASTSKSVRLTKEQAVRCLLSTAPVSSMPAGMIRPRRPTTSGGNMFNYKCLECGKKYNAPKRRCSKCGGGDIDLDVPTVKSGLSVFPSTTVAAIRAAAGDTSEPEQMKDVPSDLTAYDAR
jgi:hypothetical protein